MVKLNILYLSFVLIVCQIKIVSSIVLNLSNIVEKSFEIEENSSDGVITTKIYSKRRKPITRICRGNVILWTAIPGESVKSFTIFTFQYSGKKLLAIEINNPNKDDAIYFFTHREHYIPIDKKKFDRMYQEYSQYASKFSEKLIQSTSPKQQPTKYPTRGRPRKRKAETDDTGGPKKKTSAVSEKLEPEIIQVEVGSDDEGTDDFLVVSTSQKVDLYSETVDTTTGTSIHPKEQQVKILTQIRYTQTDTHESEDTETQTVIPTSSTDTQTDQRKSEDTMTQTDSHETKNIDTQTDTHESKETETQTVIPTDSTETQTDTHETEDIGIQTKLRTRYPKKQHAVKTNSVQTQTEMVVPIGGEFDDEDSEGEIIPVLIGSDGEYEELPMFPGEEESDIEFQISSDSDMDIDESTDDHIIQSDAITQTDKQNDNRDPSTLPIKKRPYKPD